MTGGAAFRGRADAVRHRRLLISVVLFRGAWGSHPAGNGAARGGNTRWRGSAPAFSQCSENLTKFGEW